MHAQKYTPITLLFIFFSSLALVYSNTSSHPAYQATPEELVTVLAQQRLKVYTVEQLNLDRRSMEIILLYQVFHPGNRALQDFLKERQDHHVHMPPPIWKSLKLFLGDRLTPRKCMLAEYLPQDTPKTVEMAMALRLTSPTTDISLLRRDQDIVKTLIKHPRIAHDLREQLYRRLKNIEPSLLALYDNDLLWSDPYQKKLTRFYYNAQGKFTNWLGIELVELLKKTVCICLAIGSAILISYHERFF